MKDYYEWTGIDANGKAVVYQSEMPAAETESAVLDFLIRTYKNLTITNFRKIDMRELKPATGAMDSKAFTHGILDEVRRELGLIPGTLERSLLRMAEGTHTKRRSLIRDGADELYELTKPKTPPLASSVRHARSLIRRINT